MRARAGLLLAIGLSALAVVIRLLMYAPEIVETPLVSYTPGMQPVPVDIPGSAVLSIHGTRYVHRIKLRIEDPSKLLPRRAIRLVVATHLTQLRLEKGELTIAGTPCKYRTAPQAVFPNNAPLVFSRPEDCNTFSTVPSGDAELMVTFSTAGRPALWTYTQPDFMVPTGAVTIVDPAVPMTAGRPALRGDLMDQYARGGVRTMDLLAAMWQLPSSSRTLWLVLVTALAAVMAGAVLFPLAPLPDVAGATSAARAGVAAGLIAAGLGLAVSVIVPPFQAPDEPSHFLGLLQLSGRADAAPEVENWAMAGHFERLHSDGAERFRPIDARQREQGTWRDVHPTDFGRRSRVTWLWGKGLSFVRDWSIPSTFLLVRTSHALTFALALAIGVAAVTRFGSLPLRQLVIFPLLLAPTMPFFGMHISNHGPLVAAYALLACGIFLVVNGGSRLATGSLLLIGTGVAVTMSRSALPILPLSGAAALALLLPLRAAGHENRRDVYKLTKRVAVIVGLLLGIVLVASLWVNYPHVPPVVLLAKPPEAAYLLDVLSTAFAVRLRDHDFLLVTSFWGGFGWLDRPLPEGAVSLLMGTTAAATITTFLALSESGRGALARGGIVAAGAVASLAAYAVSTLRFSPDIHGRYLLGLYVAMLCVAWTGVLHYGAHRRWTSTLLLAIITAGYGATLCFLLSAYF